MACKYIKEDDFELMKLNEIFSKLPKNQYKYQHEWIYAFSISEIKLLVKFDDNELYQMKLDTIKLLISNYNPPCLYQLPLPPLLPI